MDKFKQLISEYMGGVPLQPAVHMHYDTPWQRRDLVGVHPQKQEGLFWVGANVPVGRITAQDLEEFARIADTYGDGTVRLTCEENILFPNIPKANVDAMLGEMLYKKFKVFPGVYTTMAGLKGSGVHCVSLVGCNLLAVSGSLFEGVSVSLHTCHEIHTC